MFLSSLMAIAAVLIMGVISPGPSFIFVARNAVARSRLHGMVTALGTGAGAAIFSIMAMLGLQKVLTAVPELFIGLKVAGGLYLLWLGYKFFAGRRSRWTFPPAGWPATALAEDLPRRAVYSAQQSQNGAGVRLNFYRPAAGADPHRLLLHRAADELSDRRKLVFAGGAGAVCRPPAPRLPAAEAADRHRHRDGAGALGLRLIATSLTR
ncbi:amino acid exporter [Klebsiella pneumoniae]|nr:amino acid exporter [Klebsiella pneumoniae]